MEVAFKNKIYDLDKDKLLYIFSKLTDRDFKNFDDDKIIELMNKYKLFDEVFLEEITSSK